MNDDRIWTCQQVAQPSKQRGLMPSSYAHIYIVKVDNGCDDVYASLFVANILVVLISQLSYCRYQVVHKTCLVVTFYFLEFVE